VKSSRIFFVIAAGEELGEELGIELGDDVAFIEMGEGEGELSGVLFSKLSSKVSSKLSSKVSSKLSIDSNPSFGYKADFKSPVTTNAINITTIIFLLKKVVRNPTKKKRIQNTKLPDITNINK